MELQTFLIVCSSVVIAIALMLFTAKKCSEHRIEKEIEEFKKLNQELAVQKYLNSIPVAEVAVPSMEEI